jgi:hypothetical protein
VPDNDPIVAVAIDELRHLPPVIVLVNVEVLLTQTDVLPNIGALGCTVILFNALQVGELE